MAATRRLAPELLVTAKTQRWSPEEFLRTLIEAEITARDESNARNRMRTAAFPVLKRLADFDVDRIVDPEGDVRLPGLTGVDPRQGERLPDRPSRHRQEPHAEERQASSAAASALQSELKEALTEARRYRSQLKRIEARSELSLVALEARATAAETERDQIAGDAERLGKECDRLQALVDAEQESVASVAVAEYVLGLLRVLPPLEAVEQLARAVDAGVLSGLPATPDMTDVNGLAQLARGRLARQQGSSPLLEIARRIAADEKLPSEVPPLDEAPLGLIDDLLERGLITTRKVVRLVDARPEDRSYLLGRAEPKLLSDPEAAALEHWDALGERALQRGETAPLALLPETERAFWPALYRLGSGDLGALTPALNAAPVRWKEALQALDDLRDGQPVARVLAEDATTWPIVESLITAPEIARAGEIHAWLWLRRSLTFARAGQFGDAYAAAQKCLGLEECRPRWRIEALVLRAYCEAHGSSPEEADDSLEDALALATQSAQIARLEANASLVRAARDIGSPYELSPWLSLGLEDRAPQSEWFPQYMRRLREAADLQTQYELNWAMSTLEAGDVKAWYRAPLSSLAAPNGSGLFRPSPSRLQRRSREVDAQQVAAMAERELGLAVPLLVHELLKEIECATSR